MEQIEFIEDKKRHSILTKFILIILIIFCVYAAIKNNRSPIVTTVSYTEHSIMDDPVQTDITTDEVITKQIDNDYVAIIHPRANYSMTVKIKGINTMNFTDPTWRHELSKYDLGVVWGKLADEHYDKYIEYSQINRFLTWTYKLDIGLSNSYISTHISNNHIIPANDNVLRGIGSLQKDDICYIEGKLVDYDIKDKDNKIVANMKTSLVRNDSGDGACETIYVEKIVLGNVVYQ